MASAEKMFRKGDLKRYLIDKFVRIAVKGGSLVVLGALLLIFIYLSYMVFPLFQRPNITLNQMIEQPHTETVIGIGMDSTHQYVYQFTESGRIQAFDVNKHESVFDHQLDQAPTSFAAFPTQQLYAYGMQTGHVRFFKFDSSTSDAFSHRSPSIDHTKAPSLPFVTEDEILLNGSRTPILQLSFTQTEDQRVVAGLSSTELAVMVAPLQEPQHPLSNVIQEKKTQRFEIPLADILKLESYPQVLLDPQVQVSQDGAFVYLLADARLWVYQIKADALLLRETVNIQSLTESYPVQFEQGLGRESILIRLANGHLTQWFDVLVQEKRQLKFIRQWNLSFGQLAIGQDQQVLADLKKNGEISIWHFTNPMPEEDHIPLWSSAIQAFAFSSSGNQLIVSQAEGIRIFDLNNPFPEINLYTLWNRIWYEGYEQADYVWQSSETVAGESGKFSVVPLIFGSVKVAVYTLILAIPLALGGAIYTAYFMPMRMRRVIKPVIEIMEALPTVILGFIAAVWLAPLLEQHLTAVFIFFLSTPILFLTVAFIWSELPIRLRQRMPKSGHLLLLIPLIFLNSYMIYLLEARLETFLFSGDAKLFITQTLGVNVEQRNAIVIGLAMGFAVIPTIFTIAEDAIFSVPKHLTHGSLALGATHWQTLVHVVLLTASPGIFSAVMMGLGRAIGETMIVLMATGNTPLMEWNLFEGLRTLSANIAIEMPESQVGSAHYRVLFLTAFLLFSFTFLLNTVAEYVRLQHREKYQSL